MVTRRVPVTECDRCGSTEQVAHYRMQRNEKNPDTGRWATRTYTFDGCSECAKAAPLDEWGRLSRSRRGRKVVEPAAVKKAASRRRVKKG